LILTGYRRTSSRVPANPSRLSAGNLTLFRHQLGLRRCESSGGKEAMSATTRRETKSSFHLYVKSAIMEARRPPGCDAPLLSEPLNASCEEIPPTILAIRRVSTPPNMISLEFSGSIQPGHVGHTIRARNYVITRTNEGELNNARSLASSTATYSAHPETKPVLSIKRAWPTCRSNSAKAPARTSIQFGGRAEPPFR